MRFSSAVTFEKDSFLIGLKLMFEDEIDSEIHGFNDISAYLNIDTNDFISRIKKYYPNALFKNYHYYLDELKFHALSDMKKYLTYDDEMDKNLKQEFAAELTNTLM